MLYWDTDVKAVPYTQVPLRSQGDRSVDDVITDDSVWNVQNEYDVLTRTCDFPEGGSKDFVKLDAEDCALRAGTPSFPGGLLLGLTL